MSRCMSSAEARSDFPDQEQRLAFCFATFEGARKMEKNDLTVCLKKTDAALQIVWGEVYVPMVLDSEGDFMTADEIRKTGHRFIAEGRVEQMNVEHEDDARATVVVESFVVRKGDPDFIEGSWVLGVHIPNAELWELVEKGEINGFSLEGKGNREAVKVDMNIQRVLTGRTLIADGHDHEFVVEFDENGRFLGGTTRPGGAGGHAHRITRGTVTDVAEGHVHRYSFAEDLVPTDQGRAA